MGLLAIDDRCELREETQLSQSMPEWMATPNSNPERSMAMDSGDDGGDGRDGGG
jgi:hypothetical protein